LNDRIEIFDGDGNFISTFGKNCDAPGCFERPKGIAVDSDGYIWVADSMMDRMQIFTHEGQVAMVIGNHGTLPSQFSDLVGVAYDKVRHRMFTTEQYPGRMQEFRYITEEEVQSEKKRAAEERQKKFANASAAAAPAGKPEEGQAPKPPEAGGQQPTDKAVPTEAPGSTTK
jgi:hypothetical protein